MIISVILNLNLSFGDNFYNGESSTWFVPVASTLLGVIIAFGLTLFRDFLSKRKKSKSHKRYFIKTLNTALEYIKQAIAGYKISVKKQESDLYEYHSIKTIHFKHLNYLLNLHSSDLLDILPNKSYDDINDVFTNIEHIKHIIECINLTKIDTQKQYLDLINNIIQNYNSIKWNLKARESLLFNKNDTISNEYKYIVEELDNLNIKDLEIVDPTKKYVPNLKLIEAKLLKLMNDDLFKFLDQDLSSKVMINVKCIFYDIRKIKANNESILELLQGYCNSLEDDLLIINSSTTVNKLIYQHIEKNEQV